MKRLILISALITTAAASYAQTCSKSDALFKTENYGSPKEVRTLGSNPEFPFLRGLSTPEQVAASIRKNGKRNAKNIRNMKGLLCRQASMMITHRGRCC